MQSGDHLSKCFSSNVVIGNSIYQPADQLNIFCKYLGQCFSNSLVKNSQIFATFMWWLFEYLNIWFEYLNSCHIYQVTIWVFEYLLYLSGDYLSQSFSPPLSGIRTNIKLPTRKVLPTNISNLPFMRWYFNKKFGNEQEFEYILQWYWKALNLLQQLVSKVFLQSLSQVRKLINHEGIWIPIITIRFSSRYETVIS